MTARRKAVARKPSQGAAAGAGLPPVLLSEVRELILEARQRTAQAVNAGLTLLYWQVGDRIRREVLKEKRAEYGTGILQALSAKLEAEFGRGFAEKNLRRMVQFAEVFPEREIVVSLLRQLTWTHFIHVAEYLTELPPRELLERRLHDAVLRARMRLVQAVPTEANGGAE